MPPKILTLFHAPCGQRISRVRGVKPGTWTDALLRVGKDLEKRRVCCPRCRLAVSFVDLVPSVDDEQFEPIKTPDEARLVGFGAGQTGDPGHKI